MAKQESLVQHILNATRYSIAGLRFAFTQEMAFRWEVLLFVFLIPAGLWMGHELLEKFLLVLIPVFILIVELINSAIEAVVNLVVGEKRHPLAKAAKDMASAAIFLGFILLGCVWWVVLV